VGLATRNSTVWLKKRNKKCERVVNHEQKNFGGKVSRKAVKSSLSEKKNSGIFDAWPEEIGSYI
jgi:hypothetical protein